jgi:predicted aminopeptidase
VGYVVKSGWYQMEMLAKREPIDAVLQTNRLNPEQAERLALVPGIKAFGEQLGLAETGSYESISLDWQRTIYNVSACHPIAFEPKTWWFPIVGRVPYLGFFREQDAERRANKLRQHDLDVWVRTAGAYSTLGWFRDPVLPAMLEWTEADLSETLLHETAHATLWVKGSVRFNESYANVVGKLAADAYMREKYGSDSPEVQEMLAEQEDLILWRELLHRLYKELDTVYQDPDSGDDYKYKRKQEILDALPQQVAQAPFSDRKRFDRASRKGPWNNARLLQFRTYNAHREAFDAVLETCGREISCFIETIREITHGQSDPYVALYEHLSWEIPKNVKDF